MAQPYVGEIRMFAGNFAPAGWMFCDGTVLPIAENETLFVLIGTTYGGDGETTFALPDLRGRVPVHQGNGFIVAETGGAEEVALTVQQIPSHSHAVAAAAGRADTRSPRGAVPAVLRRDATYGAAVPLAAMSPDAVQAAGGSQPHDNMQPYLCVSFIISLFGIYPTPS
jgi:microcystin-dependent protein